MGKKHKTALQYKHDHEQMFKLRNLLEHTAMVARECAALPTLTTREQKKIQRITDSLWASRDLMLPVLGETADRNPYFVGSR